MGVIIAARKMVKVIDKFPKELMLMANANKKVSSIKRCMMHIFEFYEETFPENSLQTQDTFSNENSEKSERNQEFESSDKLIEKTSDLTTPTDVETPAKLFS